MSRHPSLSVRPSSQPFRKRWYFPLKAHPNRMPGWKPFAAYNAMLSKRPQYRPPAQPASLANAASDGGAPPSAGGRSSGQRHWLFSGIPPCFPNSFLKKGPLPADTGRNPFAFADVASAARPPVNADTMWNPFYHILLKKQPGNANFSLSFFEFCGILYNEGKLEFLFFISPAILFFDFAGGQKGPSG